jgi:hypothetical protein
VEQTRDTNTGILDTLFVFFIADMGYFVYILAVSDLVGVKEAEASFYNRPDPDPQAEKSKPISRESTLQLKLKRKKQKVERKDSVN